MYIRTGICEKCWWQMPSTDDAYIKAHSLIPPRLNPAHEHFYRRIIKKVGDGKVLDVGCGHGFLLSRLRSQRRSLYGMDVTNGAVRVARDRIEEGNFHLANARKIPFESDTFDYLICSDVLEHIEGDEAVRECYRVLKPGGAALITVPNGKGPWGKYFVGHIRLFSFESIVALLKEAGFEIVSGQKFGLHVPLVTVSLGVLSQALDKNLPFSPELNIDVPEFLATTFMIVCRKPSVQ
ncbi:MAG TPA: class I SAM-dependent methyltransferase [Dehalococcoidia bacterium]|nr:class I SAM-dependent methyltransferase [Dehalococcoidia bacterium]